MDIREKIKFLEHLKKQAEEQRNLWIKECQGERHDVEDIPFLYRRFKDISNPTNKENKDVFVCVVYFMYCPDIFLYKRSRKGKIRRKIANTLNTFPSEISMRLSRGKILVMKNKSFYKEVQRVYDALSQHEV